MIDTKYAYSALKDQHYWQRATINDAKEIAQLAYDYYRTEIQDFFTPSTQSVEWNAKRDIIEQEYNILKTYISVARSTVSGRIIAYCWATPDYTVWSPDPQCYIKMVHVDLSLPVKVRIRLVNQILDQVHCYAHMAGIPVVVSTTMREDQDGFLSIHRRRGYTVRGSFAYIRLPLGSSEVSSVVSSI